MPSSMNSSNTFSNPVLAPVGFSPRTPFACSYSLSLVDVNVSAVANFSSCEPEQSARERVKTCSATFCVRIRTFGLVLTSLKETRDASPRLPTTTPPDAFLIVRFSSSPGPATVPSEPDVHATVSWPRLDLPTPVANRYLSPSLQTPRPPLMSPIEIDSVAMWNNLLRSATAEGQVVVVDFHAQSVPFAPPLPPASC